MSDMAKFPYLTRPKGRNWTYKRDVDPELLAEGRLTQIWRSLGTPDRKKAEAAYGAMHHEVEALFARWRREDQQLIEPKTELATSAPVPAFSVPANRQVKPFKGRPLVESARLVSELQGRGNKVDLLNAITINDKIGTIGLFFAWAKSRDSSVVNPVVTWHQAAKEQAQGQEAPSLDHRRTQQDG